VSPRCPRTAVNSQQQPPVATHERKASAGSEPTANAREHARHVRGQLFLVAVTSLVGNHGPPHHMRRRTSVSPSSRKCARCRFVAHRSARASRPPGRSTRTASSMAARFGPAHGRQAGRSPAVSAVSEPRQAARSWRRRELPQRPRLGPRCGLAPGRPTRRQPRAGRARLHAPRPGPDPRIPACRGIGRGRPLRLPLFRREPASTPSAPGTRSAVIAAPAIVGLRSLTSRPPGSLGAPCAEELTTG
jgi:hypothetical protein